MRKEPTQDARETRLGVLDEHLRAENRHDVDAIMATYGQSPEIVINDQRFATAESIRKFHERLGFGGRGGFSELRVDERRRYVSDDAIVIEQTLRGRHTRIWQGIEATGREIAVPVCTIYSFDGAGKLAGERVYFDSVLLLRQLGALPS